VLAEVDAVEVPLADAVPTVVAPLVPVLAVPDAFEVVPPAPLLPVELPFEEHAEAASAPSMTRSKLARERIVRSSTLPGAASILSIRSGIPRDRERSAPQLDRALTGAAGVLWGKSGVGFGHASGWDGAVPWVSEDNG
jgi:hypothetical protein